jgi:hypothetical protein
MTDRTIVQQLLGQAGPDPGCDECFGFLDEYAELVVAGKDAKAVFPQVAAHLRDCDACREDAEGVIVANAQRAGGTPHARQ